MKNIVMVRHSIAHSGRSFNSDYERTLTEEGIKTARTMAIRINSKDIKPGIILTSPAVRARQTAELFATEFGYEFDNIIHKELLYDAINIESLIYLINEQEDSAGSLFIFGHNPTLSFLAATLAPGFSDSLEPCGIVGIEYDLNKWSSIENGSGRIAFQIVPK